MISIGTDNRKAILVSLVLVMVVVSGCDGGGNGIVDVNYYEGSDGLTMEFIENSPPEKLYPDIEYPITVTLRNEGAFSLLQSRYEEDLYASMTLIHDPFFFEESSVDIGAREELYLEGKSIYWPGGETRVFTAGSLIARNVGENRIGADTDIVASLCFPYETRLTKQICIDNDPFENSDPSQPCHTEDLVFRDQGAPVAVKRVEVLTMPVGTQRQEVLVRQGITDDDGALVGFEEVMSEEMVTVLRPAFRFSLRNVGDGQVIRGRERGEQKLCLKEPGETLLSNSVVVNAFLGSKELECRPENVIMRDDEAEVTCMLKPEDDFVVTRNYYDILQVYVSYVYQVREKLTVEIDDSMNAYSAPKYTDFKCMDFDNDYASCKSFSETTPLDCYYCKSLRKCFNKGECETLECPDGTEEDRYSRTCGRPCPEPTARAAVNTDLDEVTLTCVDNRYVSGTDEERCGCAVLAYKFVDDRDSCDDTVSYEQQVTGTYDNGRLTKTIPIPEHLMDGEQHYVCVIGRAADSGSSEPSYALIRYAVTNPVVQTVGDNNI